MRSACLVVAPGRPAGAVALERPRDEGAEPVGLVLEFADPRMCSTRSSSVSTCPYIMVAVVDMPSRWAWRITSSHASDLVFLGAMIRAHAVDQELGAAARLESSPASRRRVSVSGTAARAPRDVLDLGRRQRVEMDLVARLDRGEQILVVVDPEVGMVAALHEEAGAADRERLLDLLVDHGLRQEVRLARGRRGGGRRRRSRSR